MFRVLGFRRLRLHQGRGFTAEGSVEVFVPVSSLSLSESLSPSLYLSLSLSLSPSGNDGSEGSQMIVAGVGMERVRS